MAFCLNTPQGKVCTEVPDSYAKEHGPWVDEYHCELRRKQMTNAIKAQIWASPFTGVVLSDCRPTAKEMAS